MMFLDAALVYFINFEHISQLASIVGFEQVNVSCGYL